MIGVALVSLLTIFAGSIKSSGDGAFRKDFHGNVIIDSGAIDSASGFSSTLTSDLKARAGVRTVTEQRNAAVNIDGEPNILNAYDVSTLGTLFDLGHITGALSDLGANGIAVKAQTGPNAVKLGDTRAVTFPTGTVNFKVLATYDGSVDFLGSQFVDLAAFASHLPITIDARIYINADNIRVIDAAAAKYPTAKVLTTDAFITQQNGNIDTILTLMYTLLGLAVLIALLGIANTLALSIHERKRELGLLRAVGMSSAQVRASVRWESAIIALFGTFLGLFVGTFLGWALVRAMAKHGVDQLSIPIAPLVGVMVIAIVSGVAAAILPARRAARIDILKAIATI